MAISNTIVGVYDTHESAVGALEALKKAGFPVKDMSIIGMADIIETELHATAKDVNTNIPIEIGIVFGPILGLLTGMSIVAIPGLGFIYGAGAVIGMLAGLDFGLIAGGVSTLFLGMGVNKEDASIYQAQLQEGKYIVTYNGEEKVAEKAKQTLHTVGFYIDLQHHKG